jgi:hypothetical protein
MRQNKLFICYCLIRNIKIFISFVCEKSISLHCCSRPCSFRAQGEKPDSSQVVLTGRDLGDREHTQVQIHPHANNTNRQFSKDLLLTALILLQMHSSNEGCHLGSGLFTEA